jgi:hypothetical protein
MSGKFVAFLALALGMGVCTFDQSDADASPPPIKKKTPPKTQTPAKAQNKFNVPTTPLTANPLATAGTTTGTNPATNFPTPNGKAVKTEDKEADFEFTSDVKAQKLMKDEGGLVFVVCSLEDVSPGNLVTLSLIAKEDPNKPTNVNCTVVKVSEKGVTVKVAVPMGSEVPGLGKFAALVSIRSTTAN